MSFVQPWWWLLLPVVVPAILLMHARRRRDVLVASLVVWRRVPTTTSSAPDRRRFPWREPSLWLQLLAAVAVTAALAQPLVGTEPEPTHWIVLVDASSSMNATDLAPHRFGAAIATVRQRWGVVATPDRVSVVRVGQQARVVAAKWPVGPALAGVLDTLAPGQGRPDWAGAAERVAALAREGDGAKISVFTDAFGAAGAREALAGLTVAGLPPLDPTVVVLGDALVNVGIADVEAAPRGERDDQWTVGGRVVTVGFQGGESLRVVAAYRPFGGDAFLPWGGVDVVLDSSGIATFELPLDLPGPGELEIRGPSGDRLPVDDRVRLSLRTGPVRVAIVGPLSETVLRVLAAIDAVEVYVADELGDVDGTAAFDLVIVTGSIAGVPATSTLWLGAVPDGVAAGEALVAPLPPLVAGRHPLVADVDPAAIAVRRAVPLRLLTGTTPLLSLGDQVVAWARTTSSGRQIVVGFAPDDSTWPAQLSFPAFLAGVVDWAAPRAWSHESGGCAVGYVCAWPAEAFDPGWRLVDPEGRTVVEPPALASPDDDPLARAVWDEGWFDAGFRPDGAGRYALAWQDAELGLPVVGPAIGAPPIEESEVLAELPPPSSFGVLAWLAVLALILVGVDLLRWGLAGGRGGVKRARGAWTLAAVAVGAWIAAIAAAPLPLPAAGGSAVVVGTSVEGAGVRAPGWSQDRVAVRPVAAHTSDTAPDLVASDVPLGLELALAVASDARERRVVVAGDVADLTAADWLRIVELARSSNVSIDAVVDPANGGTGARAVLPAVDGVVRALSVPDGVRAGGRFTLRADHAITDDVAWRWTAELVSVIGRGDSPTDDGEASSLPSFSAMAETTGIGGVGGELTLQAGGQGDATYRLAWWLDGASEPAYETQVTVPVGPRPKVLVVSRTEEEGALLVAGLEAQAVDTRVVVPFRMPTSLEALAAYDAVALVNVPASEVFTAYQEMLETFVRDLGGGLLIFGGPTAFGPGGYFRTPLEDLSPLSAQVTDESPEVAIAFVLDRSGSMNGAVGTVTRMDVAKVATLEALELLGERSQAAVIVFDAEARVLLPFHPVTDRRAFEIALGQVDAAGGTSIYPGLVAAYELMRASDAATRHVVVMTDGLSQDADFPGVLGALNGLGIATSFVGVGSEADRRQLRTLADLSGGALHFALDFRALPSVLAQEALMLSADPIVQRPTVVDWVAGSVPEFLQGVLDGTLPVLDGYVRTTAKDEASVHLVERQEDDPILASWRYGLGRVVGFASEAGGPWSASWTELADYGRIWSQTLRWLSERPVAPGWRLDLATTSGTLDVIVHVPSDVPRSDVEGHAVELVDGAGAVVATRPLTVASPTRATARFEIASDADGAWTVRLTASGAVRANADVARTVTWPPAPVRMAHVDTLTLASLATRTGGAVVNGAEALVWPRVAPIWTWRSSQWPWLAMGLVAFLASLALRYGVLVTRRRRGLR